jgi:hypothetical protein
VTFFEEFATKPLSRFLNFLLLFDKNYNFQEKKQHKIKFFELVSQISFLWPKVLNGFI